MVVEGEFIILLDVSCGKYSDTNLAQDIPFSGYAVWLARMVDKSGKIALVSRINNFSA